MIQKTDMKKIVRCRALMNFPLFLLVFYLPTHGNAGRVIFRWNTNIIINFKVVMNSVSY
jgi:hypothetical protein